MGMDCPEHHEEANEEDKDASMTTQDSITDVEVDIMKTLVYKDNIHDNQEDFVNQSDPAPETNLERKSQQIPGRRGAPPPPH